MIDSTNPYLQAIFKNYGPRWDPSFLVDQNPREGTGPKFAVDIALHANEILEGVTKACPGFEVELFFVENVRINAFAGKVSDTEEHYAVGVYSGTITKLFDVFKSPAYLAVLRGNLAVLGNRTDSEFQQLSLYFASLFLIFHEFSHVIRGHLNFGKALAAADVLWTEGDEHDTVASPEMIRRRHLSECDADASAGILLAGVAHIQAKQLSHELGRPIGDVMRDLVMLVTTANHLLFCLFDDARKEAHPFYPPPPLRSAIVLGHVAARTHRDGYDSRQLLNEMIPALFGVEGLRRHLNLKQGAYDLAEAFASWTATYREQLKDLGSMLIPYVPCKKASAE